MSCAVRAAVLSVAPGADFTDPNWGCIELPGVSIEVNLADADPFTSFALHVRATDQAAADATIRALLDHLGVRAFDTDADGGIFA